MAQLAPSPFRDSTTRLQWSSQGLLGCSRLSLPCKSALAKAAPPSRTAGVARASFLDEILRSEPLVSATSAFLTGQLLKPFTSGDSKGQKLHWKLLFKSGGMPSSHSSTVCGMATGVYFQSGGDSSDFAMAIIFACIVMYDAQGVRRAVGKQAEVLNTLLVPSLAQPEFLQQHGVSVVRNALSEIASQPSVTAQPLAARPASTAVLATEHADTGHGSTAAAVAGATTVTVAEDHSAGPAVTHQPQQKLGGGEAWQRSQVFWDAAKKEPSLQAGEVVEPEIGQLEGWRHIPLKESVGHTKKQVTAGALTGWLLGIAIHNLFFS